MAKLVLILIILRALLPQLWSCNEINKLADSKCSIRKSIADKGGKWVELHLQGGNPLWQAFLAKLNAESTAKRVAIVLRQVVLCLKPSDIGFHFA